MKKARGVMLMGRTAMGRKLILPVKLTRRRVFTAFLAIVVISAATAWVALWYFSFNVRFARSKTALDTYAAQAMASYPVLPRMPPHLGGL